MKWNKIILGGIVSTGGLLIAVVAFDLVSGMIFPGKTIANNYSPKEAGIGVLAEGIRGLILSYLYFGYVKNKTYSHALNFGLLASIMVGSVWIILGHTYFGTNVLQETIIIIIQGILSDLGLGLVYRNIENTK